MTVFWLCVILACLGFVFWDELWPFIRSVAQLYAALFACILRFPRWLIYHWPGRFELPEKLPTWEETEKIAAEYDLRMPNRYYEEISTRGHLEPQLGAKMIHNGVEYVYKGVKPPADPFAFEFEMARLRDLAIANRARLDDLSRRNDKLRREVDRLRSSSYPREKPLREEMLKGPIIGYRSFKDDLEP